MHKQELPELAQRLAQLADALGGRAPSASGLLVWGDALSECSREDVLGALSDWPKTHAKMPVPSEILKLCRERMSERIERRAQENAVRAAANAERVIADLGASSSVEYREFAAKLRAIMDRRRRTPSKDWANRLRDRELNGERLTQVQMAMWRAALDERADPELMAERAAIQAESALSE